MNSVLMTTIVAGQVLSQATFGTMTECVSARDRVTEHNDKSVLIVCSYKSNELENARQSIDLILKAWRDAVKDIENRSELAVEPNEWITK